MADRLGYAVDETVRVAVYAHFVAHGAAPDSSALAAQLGLTAVELAASYVRLASERALVLGEGAALWMAIPFSAVPTDVVVRSDGVDWWANCAFDGLGIPAMLGIDALVETVCPQSGAPISVEVRGHAPSSTSCVLHMAVPLAQWWDDIGDT
jgi:Alkylmercury lyase